MFRLCLGERLDRVGTILREHVAVGGKRLRARLALAATEGLGQERKDGVGWAAACELLHNATLVHDDLQDGDRVRRGHDATWVRYGAAQAINAGDLCLMLPYLAVESVEPVSLRWPLARLLAGYACEVVRGQAEELELLGSGRLDREAYDAASSGKTAALFALPVHGAALRAGLDAVEARQVADEFRAIGLLFQLQDDVLDLFGDKGRAAPGSDIAEGKVSALVVEHLRRQPEDHAWLSTVLCTPRERTRQIDIDEATRRFREGGALRAVWDRIRGIEREIFESPVLAHHPRVHVLACDLVARALVPIVHTHPDAPAGRL